jgi:hypothetical protein
MLRTICAFVLLLGLIGCGGNSSMPHSALTPTPTPTPTGTPFANDQHLAQASPVKMGTSGGNSTDFVNNGKTITCCSGTLGSLIMRGSNFFILSNNHVLDKSDRGTAGDPITQPGLVDDNCGQLPSTVVANLTEAATLKPTTMSTSGACAGQPAPCGPSPSNVDAAIAQVVLLPTAQVDTSGAILDLGPAGSAGIAAAPPSSMLADPATVLRNSEGVAKSGRHSGLTCSTLQSVMTTVSVQYDASCGGSVAFTATFSNQVIINGGTFSAMGDSGSLVVTSDTARPVGLLFAGNSTSTSANPIQDVLNVFTPTGGPAPSVVGAGDHAVSCALQASASSASLTQGASSTALSSQERQRVAAVRQRHAAELMRDRSVTSVDTGASDDSPGEGALVIRFAGTTPPPLPQLIDGVRTKVVSAQAGALRMPVLSAQDMDNAAAVKENHAAELMSQPGIQGVGVGRSDDNPAETAIVIYVINGATRPAIPAVLDGVRTKIVAGDRFRAFGWGKKQEPVTKCKKK